ncbi:MAG TPA: metallophosphatase, partial [Armatimonadota bacterium]
MRRIRPALLYTLLLFSLGYVWPVPLQILATGDMHGWLQSQPMGKQQVGGAAELLAYWQHVEGYAPGKFLVLGCGDFNTGPVLATAMQGDPMVEVMNLMGYNACALGNHEFDYGIDRIAHWQALAKFPLLAANLANLDGTPTTLTPPYSIIDVQGVKVGIVGLITTGLPTLTNQATTLKVLPYAETLRRVVPEVRKHGAQVVIVLSHIPQPELKALANQVAELDIPLMLGGHSHELDQLKEGKTWVVNSGEQWDAYSRIDLDYDQDSGKTVVLRAAQVWLQQTKPEANSAVAQAIARWQKTLDVEYGKIVGYTATGLARQDGIYNFVDDCTLAMDPLADVALTNDGSMRQDI